MQMRAIMSDVMVISQLPGPGDPQPPGPPLGFGLIPGSLGHLVAGTLASLPALFC